MSIQRNILQTAKVLALLTVVGAGTSPACALVLQGNSSAGSSTSEAQVGPAAAPADAARAQVAAATNNAASALRSDILAQRISPSLTVGQFLDRIDSPDALDDVLARAQQIGGPRWIDDQTCQVRLEMSGQRVVYALVSAAAVRPKLSPMPPAVLDRRLADWKDRTFGATGTSVSAVHVQGIRPPDIAPSWTRITDDERSRAVSAARQDADRRVIDSIRTIQLSNTQTVGDVLQNQPVEYAVQNWLATRPVTQVRFNDDLQVELTVAAPPDALADTFIQSARAIPGSTLPGDEKSLDELKREFARRVSAAIGHAGVNPNVAAAAATRPAPLAVPDDQPAWVGRFIQAEATAPRSNSQLRSARAAESKATDSLRAQIGKLQLTADLTIEQASRKDSRVDAAVSRALMRARVDKVDYRADGSAMVRVTQDLSAVWDELQQMGQQQ